MKPKAQIIESGDYVLSPLQRAYERLRNAQRMWVRLNSDNRESECVRPDIVRAIRAIAVCNRSSDKYLMIFGIGGPNPCRSDPVVLPTWKNMHHGS